MSHKPNCAFCEYFDGFGLYHVERARQGLVIIEGDCRNSKSPYFTVKSTDSCHKFAISEDLERATA